MDKGTSEWKRCGLSPQSVNDYKNTIVRYASNTPTTNTSQPKNSTTTSTVTSNNNSTSTDAETYFQQGLSYYEKGKYEDAIRCLEKAANINHTKAQGLLGECYRQTWKADKAKYWLEKSANQGDSFGEYYLGLYYYEGADLIGTTIDFQKARYWFEHAAAHGGGASLLAQTNLGEIYFLGRGVNENSQKAKEWYQKAANQGFDNAQAGLGSVYYDENNTQKAKYWYEKAANQGHDGAQYGLGVIYSEEHNMQKAIYWLEKAGDAGNEYAIDFLIDIYETGDGIPKDMQKAAYWKNKKKQGTLPALGIVKGVYESVINKDKQ